jgi:predicted Na+-dependent transporter
LFIGRDPMVEILVVVGEIAALLFVICQMLAMGLVLTVPQIIEPLKNTRLIILALVGNFILVPLVALALASTLPLSPGYSIGLILLGCAAGAPFLPKLVQVAKGDIAFSVGFMVLMMVVTIVTLPLVLSLLITGITIHPLDIAKSLVVLMLIPLGIALWVRARYEKIALRLAPYFSKVTNIALVILMLSMFVAFLPELGGTVGSMGILASLIFVLIAFGIGYVLGGPEGEKKKVLAFGTGLRNFSAAIAVAALNFTDPDVMMMVLDVIIIALVVLMLIGKVLGKRAGQGTTHTPGAGSSP